MRTLSRGLLVVVVAALAASAFASHVGAQPVSSGPAATLNKTEVSIGESIIVTISGFKAPNVTFSVCGNEARRGSADCNMVASKGTALRDDGTPTAVEMPVVAPPAACPCAIRVSSSLNDEVAVAPLVLIGQPIAPVVGGPNPDTPLVAVSINAHAAPHGVLGWIRANLGGTTTYDVTVTVKNLTSDTLHRVKLSGSVGRSANDPLATLDLKNPGEIGPGQSSQQTVSAKLPAPTLGTFVWRVPASGAGVTVIGTNTMRPRPVLLIVLVLALVADVCVLAMRALARRRATMVDTKSDMQSVTQSDGQADADRDEKHLVGSSI